jgi:GT2 family glycosyltransferase
MISVIIPTYKNKEQLLRNLKNNLQFLKDCEIIVVNDNPEISIKKDIESFKSVRLLENKRNSGFGKSVNNGVSIAKFPYIMLLNDDVVLKDTGFIKGINYFKKDKKLFAVSFAQIEKDGSIVGKNKIFWKRGLFFHQKASGLNPGENGWAEGGACIIDKKRFEKLGGFDSIYSPFYWEDIDLSYRAKKTGYRVIFDPNIVVEHHHESTIGKHFSKDFIKTIAFRNQFLFMWKNVRGRKFVSHVLFLPFNILYYCLKGESAFINGLFKALQVLFRHE